jgi:glycerophosphoryl diester phosphodiesterase
MPALIRVGHKGADGIVAGNTLASFDAALAAGVDMIEFDVIAAHPAGTGDLFVAHDHAALRRGGAPTLEQALAHLWSEAFSGVALQVDLKRQGYERRVVEQLRAAGTLERYFVSSASWESNQRVRAVEPALRVGWTVPDPLEISATFLLSQTLGRIHRAMLPGLAAARIKDGRVDALVPQWRLVTPALVQAVADVGGEIYAWTVDDAADIRRLADMGVTGVITNDPRLFAELS